MQLLRILILFFPLWIFGQCGLPLRIAFMTHLEDDWNDDNNLQAFNGHKNAILLEISFFKPYGAKVNFESAPPFLNACYVWNDNIFQTLLDSAMGTGGHSNTSVYYDSTYSLLRGLIGNRQQYLGTSGGVAPNDSLNSNNWVDSALSAGYNYINGITYTAWLQVPQSERPGQEPDSIISKDKWHDPLFPTLNENIFPRRVRSAQTFYKDSTGQLVLISGSVGTLPKLVEGYSFCKTNFCPLDSADIDSFLVKITQAVSIAQAHPNKIACIYVHVPLNYIKPAAKKYFDYLFSSLKPLKGAGQIKYATMEEIYKEFLACEVTQGILKEEKTFNVTINRNIKNLTVKSQKKIVGLELINLQGQRVRKSATHRISLEGLSHGIYLLNIYSSGKLYRKKIVF